MTVSKKVMNNTITSLLGFFISCMKVRQPLMLYDTITSTPARHDIGI